jgi:hypothetical protein
LYSSKKTAPNQTGKKRTSDDMCPSQISLCAAKRTCIAKRVAPVATQPTTRVTRSQRVAPALLVAQPTTRVTRATPAASRSDSGVILHSTAPG